MPFSVCYLVDERMDTEGYAEEIFQGLSVCAIPLSYWDLDDRSDTEDLTEEMFHGLTVCLEPLSFILDGRFDAEDLTEEIFPMVLLCIINHYPDLRVLCRLQFHVYSIFGTKARNIN